MRRVLLTVIAALAIVGVGRAFELSSVPCLPGGTPDSRDDEYVLDDGTGENSIGIIGGGTLIWLNQFQFQPGSETIDEVSVAWGQVPAGRPAEILIFIDPDNDGNPQDLTAADLVSSTAVTSEGTDSDTFFAYPVSSFVGNAGDWFFVGVCCSHLADEYPARLDQTYPMQRSWVGGDDAPGYDCANPNAGTVGALELIDFYGYPGNWMIRATGCTVMPGSPGACCLPDGGCVETYAVNCGDWLHGYWQPCVGCGDVDCDDAEGCCFVDGSCMMLTEWGCVDQGGVSQGPGTVCDPNPCVPVPVRSTEWGRIKAMFR